MEANQYRVPPSIAALSKQQAEQQRRDAEPIQAQLKASKEAKKIADAERRREVDEWMAASLPEHEEWIAKHKKALEDNALKQKAADEKLKVARKEWKATQKARAASPQASQRAERLRSQRDEATRIGQYRTLVDQIERLGTSQTQMYEDVKTIGRSLTDPERAQLVKALKSAADRLNQMTRLLNQ